MKRLRTLTGLMAICGASVLFTGCGGDDDDNGGGPAAPVQNAPNAVAGNYTLTDGSGSSTLALAANGTAYTLTGPSGTVESGNYQAERSGDIWTVNATTDDLATTRTITLTFNNANSGSYSVAQAGQDPLVGNFTFTPPGGQNPTTGDPSTGDPSTGDPSTGDPSTGDPSTGDPSTGDPTTGSTDGAPAPATLQSVSVVNTQSGTGPSDYTINLSGGASGDFTITGNSVGRGTYTYTPSGNSANLVLNYTDFPGDQDNMTLNFRQPPAQNTHTGTQKIGNDTYTINGTFTYVQ